MGKKVLTIIIILCLVSLSGMGQAETRQGMISLEGMEETIEETLFVSSSGFSFWYANERLEAYEENAEGNNGVVVAALYSDDYMVLSIISEEEVQEYAEDYGKDFSAFSTSSRAQMDVYRELEGGTFFFVSLIAENGHYLCADGMYSKEAAEGNANFFQRVLDSVSITPISELRPILPGQWVDDGEGRAVDLVLDENGDMSLQFTEGDRTVTYNGAWSLETKSDYNEELTLLFTSTDNQSHTETGYNVECTYTAYTESWIENDTLITYLILNPPISCSGVSPFEEINGNNSAALHREQGANMRVVKCKEYVSLREERSTKSTRLAKVPLGASVLAFPEYGEKNGFIYCVYNGEEGFILSEYLEPIQATQ